MIIQQFTNAIHRGGGGVDLYSRLDSKNTTQQPLKRKWTGPFIKIEKYMTYNHNSVSLISVGTFSSAM